MFILFDELAQISELSHPTTRESNYAKILAMYNDTLQGKARYIGIVMGATTQCLEERRRGMYSNDALRSRLQESNFSNVGNNIYAPVIRLKTLEQKEMLELTENLVKVHGIARKYEPNIPKEDLEYFVRDAYNRIGASEFITPRETIKSFVNILDILCQNQNTDMNIKGILNGDDFTYATRDEGDNENDDFAGFDV
jgi:hypothetical protein